MKRLFVFAMVAMLPFMAFAGKTKVLKIDFNNPIAERNTGSSLDIMSMVKGTASPVTLLSYIEAIDAAADDKNIGMIYMTPENISAGLCQIEELRAALKENGIELITANDGKKAMTVLDKALAKWEEK